ncbi:MAG: radical SAM protein [Deltaproteobacteria bacterium]|nr:radical SAM protein [Deltaproteobacteria bacterium]
MNCDKKKMDGLNINSKILNGIRPAVLSVDINNLCNLRCKHCFWEANYNDKTDMNLNILDSVKQVLNRFPSITNILWYGGEPLINKESVKLLKQGVKLIKNNLIITNGTFPLPSFNAFYHYVVSMNGIKDMHNYLRGANVYEVIKRNVIEAIKRNMPIFILYCINALNIDAIPAFLEEWSNKRLTGIGFTVYTAIQEKYPELTLNDKDRERIARLFKRYGR